MSVKISELPELNRNDLTPDDYIPIVDVDANMLKKMKYQFIKGNILYGTCDAAKTDDLKRVTLENPTYRPNVGDYILIYFPNKVGNPRRLVINYQGITPIYQRVFGENSYYVLVTLGDDNLYHVVASDQSMYADYASSTAYGLLLYDGQNSSDDRGYITTFNGQSSVFIYNVCELVAIGFSGWSANPGSDGYYTNQVTLERPIDTRNGVTVSVWGSSKVDTSLNYDDKRAYDCVELFEFDYGTQISTMTAKSKVKIPVTFYVLVTGQLITKTSLY